MDVLLVSEWSVMWCLLWLVVICIQSAPDAVSSGAYLIVHSMSFLLRNQVNEARRC
jgi:hypothetical protein